MRKHCKRGKIQEVYHPEDSSVQGCELSGKNSSSLGPIAGDNSHCEDMDTTLEAQQPDVYRQKHCENANNVNNQDSLVVEAFDSKEENQIAHKEVKGHTPDVRIMSPGTKLHDPPESETSIPDTPPHSSDAVPSTTSKECFSGFHDSWR